MIEFFQKLFSTDFAPHVYCLRLPGLIQLHFWSDIVIAASYGLIPLSLMRLVRRRRDLVFPWMFALFGVFILSCGMTHVLGAWTLWHPIYRFDGLVKLITAVASLPTAILLIKIMPHILELPSPGQLQAEITDRKRAELQVRELNAELEDRIKERTDALLKANELLAQSERRRLMAIDAAGVGTWFWNVERGEMYWDQNSRRIFGLDQGADVTPESFYAAIHEDDRPGMEAAVKAAMTISGLRKLQCRVRKPDSSERWVRFRVSGESGLDDSPKTLQGTMMDVTDQKRTEVALALLASIVESSEDAIIGLDLEGRVTSWNRAACRMFGYEAEEVAGKPAAMLEVADGGQRFDDLLRAIRRGERIEHFETVRRRKNGETLDISLTISPIIDSYGEVIGVSEIARDITRRKELDAALRTSEERFRTLAETVPDVLFIADSRGVINFLSARFFSELDHQRDATSLHQTFLSSLHPDDLRKFLDGFDAAVQSGKRFQSESRLRRPDGSYGWFVTRALPITDERQSQQWIGASTDIDRLKRTEEALLRSNGELRQFAYAAAHDLQEPLRNIVNSAGMLSITAADRLDDDSRQYLQFCIEGAQRMHGMIKDLLTYTGVIDGPAASSPRVEAGEVMGDVEANLSLAIQESKATLLYGELPEVAVEKGHLLQLFQNLVGNALKYRVPERPPVVEIKATRQDEYWLFRISDNGIGFDPQYRERIFGVFKRLHHRHEFPGTGIGLAICARIVSHYGGAIWAESSPGQGAVFSFTLPAIRRTSEIAFVDSLPVATAI